MRLTIQVKPRSKVTELVSEPDGTLTMCVSALPIEGKANREIVKWISKKLGKSSSEVRILSGVHSKTKIIEIIGVNNVEIEHKLGIPLK